LLYYMLLVCLVRTPARVKWLLASLVVDTCILAGLGVADYRGIVHIPSLSVVMEVQYVGGVEMPLRRLGGTSGGLFGDPNDFGLLIASCIIYSLYLLGDRSAGLARRAVWVLPMPLLFYALSLTYSRGGALTLMIGLGIYAQVRFGRRAAVLALLALPLLLLGGGRQMNFNISGGTGQARVAMWDLYMSMFIENPLFGVGFGQGMNHAYQVAHNSYIHVFGERGFFGGMAFLSAVLLAVWSVLRLNPSRARPPDDELVRLRTCVLASIVSYAIGIMTLSRADVYPTYTILGLAVAYEHMAVGASDRGPLRLAPRSICRLAAASVAYLVIMYIYIKRNAY
jgi:O-antigen ligase